MEECLRKWRTDNFAIDLLIPNEKRKMGKERSVVMKMTPEQEAFFEYGRAFERVCRRAELLRAARKRCTENPEKYGPEPLIAKVLLDRAINKARQKQAACRAFVSENERLCVNCKNWKTRSHNQPCKKCFDVEAHVNWESKKE